MLEVKGQVCIVCVYMWKNALRVFFLIAGRRLNIALVTNVYL